MQILEVKSNPGRVEWGVTLIGWGVNSISGSYRRVGYQRKKA